MRNTTRKRFILIAAVAISSGIIWYAIRDFFPHPGEAVIILMPPVLGSMLLLGWPKLRRKPGWKCLLYPFIMFPVIAAAVAFASYMARGRFLWMEAVIALYFLLGWRLAWEFWKRTVGRLCIRLQRWGRLKRKAAGGLASIPDKRIRRAATLAMFIPWVRVFLIIFVFAPLFAGSLIHRIKIGNKPPNNIFLEDADIHDVAFKTGDGLTIAGWYMKEPDATKAVVICHGAGANKGNFADFLTVFHDAGYNALIFDFRGHGESEGHTSTLGLLEDRDVRAAVDWLKKKDPEGSKHIYGLGSSMGAMALVRAAAQDKRIEALILDSAFVSAPLLADQHVGDNPISRLFSRTILLGMSIHAGHSLWDLDASDAIKQISPRPVFLIHGEDDRLIPPENMDILYTLAGEPKARWLGPGPHSNILTEVPFDYISRVQDFLDSIQKETAAEGETLNR